MSLTNNLHDIRIFLPFGDEPYSLYYDIKIVQPNVGKVHEFLQKILKHVSISYIFYLTF